MAGSSQPRYSYDQDGVSRSRANTGESVGARDSRIARDDGGVLGEHGPPSACNSRRGSTSRQTQEGSHAGERLLAGSVNANRSSGQLSPISTRFHSSSRNSHSTSTSASSSTPVSATSTSFGSPLLPQPSSCYNSSSEQPVTPPSQPPSELPYDQPLYPAEPTSYLSDSLIAANSQAVVNPSRNSPSPRNSSLFPSTTSNRSNSPSNSTESTGSSSRQHHHQHYNPHDDTRRSSGDSSGESVGKPELRIASTRSGERSGAQTCAKCGLPMTGQFVRALGSVFHLDCYRCQDCNKVVAAKFFPVDAKDSSGKQYPLCETDYFRRLGLLCRKCGCALRGSYITALELKFHVEHFTCSVCPTVFGPQDSYYEHDGSVYCHFHYSTRFAVKCTGCRTAILKQFVEINRNSTDEHWHPECYMIHKFWNIKLAPSPPVAKTTEPASTLSIDKGLSDPVESSRDATGPPSRALDATEYLAQEDSETPFSLKSRQKLMEEQVYRIWTVLSAFEESSAACISEMLRHVSSGQYIEGVRMAEKFVLHVETLFSAIDDLSDQFKDVRAKEIAHVRESRMLCKKVVNFFSLLSHTHETGARKMSITQELLSLVTGLAHYLKILIRIALTAALKLEREFSNKTAISQFLGRLDRLARNPDASKFSPATISSLNSRLKTGDAIDQSGVYGYQSLARAVGTLVGQGEATTDLCEGCKLTVEEECARFGTSLRWHLPCLKCAGCGKLATKDQQPAPTSAGEGSSNIYLGEFRIEPIMLPDDVKGKGSTTRFKGGKTYCSACASPELRAGFEYVTRLEQYAFLLCVALNKLYALLKQRGVVPSSPIVTSRTEASPEGDRNLYDAYRSSTDIKRMKFVSLDRHISTTTSHTPIQSTIIQSPTGRVAQSNDSAKPPVPSRRDQPQIDPTSMRSSTLPIPSSRVTREGVPPQSYRSLPPESTLSAHSADRPGFHRATTAIHIVDDQVNVNPQLRNDAPLLGGLSEPTQDEDGITLADLPQVIEAEQAREQDRYLPSRRSGILLSELSALEYFIVKHVAVLALSSDDSPLRDIAPLDDLLELIDAKKNNFWGKLFKGTEKKSVKKKGVFGISLEVLVERNGADSVHGSGPGSLRVPSFVDDCISAMKQMDMSVEGVFRKNGNIRRLKDLSEALDRDSTVINLSDENPVQLAALLKRFLRDLPDPLLTFKLFHLFLATQRVENIDERKKMMHLVCCLLPKYHRDTMEVIFVFLKWVASFSHVDEETGSKMDLLNLATVICPNILYSKGKDPYKDESFSAVRAVHELLEFQDEFWQVPEEFASILNDQDLFSNPAELTSKQILAKAEIYVRRNSTRPVATPTPTSRPGFQQAYSAPIETRRKRAESMVPDPNAPSRSRPSSFSTFIPRPPSAASSPVTTGSHVPLRPNGSMYRNETVSSDGLPSSAVR